MPENRVADLYELLQIVRQRPGMYVRDWSLYQLETICDGYSQALAIHGIEEFGTQFNKRFRDYLWARYRWSMCCGWAWGIRKRSRSAEEAFHRFFELVEQFKRSTPEPIRR
jgi:hypothetical protein